MQDGGQNFWGLFHWKNSVLDTFLSSDYPFPDIPRDIQIAKSGSKWFLYSYGIFKYDNKSWTTYPCSYLSDYNRFPLGLRIDNRGCIWVFTNNGLLRFNGSYWNLYDTSNSGLPNNYINDICFDNQNNVWIATKGAIAKYEQN
jgi:streptogramin lyase